MSILVVLAATAFGTASAACAADDVAMIESMAESISSACPVGDSCTASCKTALHKVYDISDSQLECIRDVRAGKAKEGTVSEAALRVIKQGPKIVQGCGLTPKDLSAKDDGAAAELKQRVEAVETKVSKVA